MDMNREHAVQVLAEEVDRNVDTTRNLMSHSDYKAAGRELALARTKMEEAEMWLGKAILVLAQQ
jgi:hypothetical protein